MSSRVAVCKPWRRGLPLGHLKDCSIGSVVGDDHAVDVYTVFHAETLPNVLQFPASSTNYVVEWPVQGSDSASPTQ